MLRKKGGKLSAVRNVEGKNGAKFKNEKKLNLHEKHKGKKYFQENGEILRVKVRYLRKNDGKFKVRKFPKI